MRRWIRASACFALSVGACSTAPVVERRTAVERGRDLFSGTGASDSSANKFACSTCHPSPEGQSDHIFPGAKLGGATSRPTFWGGKTVDLLTAINDCRYFFMSAQRPWTREDEDAKGMYAFLSSLPPGSTGPVPFTVPATATDLPRGSSSAGQGIYERACRSCHGAALTGAGRLGTTIPVLPDQSVASFKAYGFDATQVRLSFIEKVRHGGFLGLYGNMPPYSMEVLSDADLASLLAFLNLYP